MSDSASQPAQAKMAGWLKALIASLFSAISGAVLMYASPLVDMVIKPAKPVANFQCQATGLNVTFQNKSTGGHEGWWDFGDGSALEPFVPDQLAVTHNYGRPGTYSVKLCLKNILNDENERSATVVVDEDDVSKLPAIEAFSIVPVQGEYAPATYRIETTVKNANLCVWAVGNRPLEFSPETANGHQVRLVAFKEPGPHVVKLAVYNGKQPPIEKTVQVVVNKAPVGLVTATLEATYEAVLMEKKSTLPVVPMRFPAEQKGDVITVKQAVAAEVGYEIVNAELARPVDKQLVKSANLEIDPAKHDKVTVTCDLIRPSTRTHPPACLVQLKLTQQHLSQPTVKILEPVSMNLTTQGSTLVPLPVLSADWIVKSRKLTLTVQQDANLLTFPDGKLPHNVPVQMSPGTEYILDAVEQNGHLRIDLQPTKKPWTMIGQ